MDTRVFLHLFKSLIEALSKYDVPQRTPSKVLTEVLEEAKADNLGRLEKYPIDCDPDIQAEETKKRLAFYTSIERRISLVHRMSSIILSSKPLLPPSRTFMGDRNMEDILHQFYKTQLQSLWDMFWDMFWDMAEVQARQVEREVKRGHGIIVVLDNYSATSTSLPRTEDLKEEEHRERKLELASFQALKKFGDSLEKVISSHDISEEEKVEIINKAATHVVDVFDARLKGVPFEQSLQQKAQTLQKKGDIFSPQPNQEKTLQPPDLSEIPLYQGRRGRRKQGSPPEVRPLDFLKTHYGQWLSIYGAEQDNVFQDQIRAHDPDLIKGIDNQLRREGKRFKVRDFVKTRSARRDLELENASAEDLRKNHRLAATLYGRGKRAADKAKAAHSHPVTRK